MRKAKIREKKREEKEVDLRERRRKGEFAHKGEYMRAKDPRFTLCGATTGKLWEEGKFEPWKKKYNKLKQRYSRRWNTDEQVEYYMITDLLNTRRNRQLRSGKEHLLDNLAATKGMRALKESGRKRGPGASRRARICRWQ